MKHQCWSSCFNILTINTEFFYTAAQRYKEHDLIVLKIHLGRKSRCNLMHASRQIHFELNEQPVKGD